MLIGLAVVLAVVGHDLLTWCSAGSPTCSSRSSRVLTVGALTQPRPQARRPRLGGFAWTSFLLVFSAAAGYQISYAVYVSDYSRYLPTDVSGRKVIWWTYAGAAGSAVWLMSLGALLAVGCAEPDAIGGMRQVGNDIVPGFGTVRRGRLRAGADQRSWRVNAYGAHAHHRERGRRASAGAADRRVRVVGIVAIEVVVARGGAAAARDYLASFNVFVLLMLYFLIPWTAVNLVDFYFVRRGHYAITAIFDPRGIYGRWSWRGLVAYLVGFAAMVPFFSHHFFTGPVAAPSAAPTSPSRWACWWPACCTSRSPAGSTWRPRKSRSPPATASWNAVSRRPPRSVHVPGDGI